MHMLHHSLPEAFPAVTVPLGLTTRFNFVSPSSVVSGRGCSSIGYHNRIAFLLRDRHRLTISSAIARFHRCGCRCWLRNANAS